MYIKFDLQIMSICVDEMNRICREIDYIHSQIDDVIRNLRCDQLNELVYKLYIENETLMETLNSIKVDSKELKEVIELYRRAQNIAIRNNDNLINTSLPLNTYGIYDSFANISNTDLFVESWLKEIVENESQ